MEIGDPESLREFDEERERMRELAEKETKQMIAEGLLLI